MYDKIDWIAMSFNYGSLELIVIARYQSDKPINNETMCFLERSSNVNYPHLRGFDS